LRIVEQLALALKTEFSLKIFKPGGPGCPPRTPASYAYVPAIMYKPCVPW